MFQTIISINKVLLGTEIILFLVCFYMLITRHREWKSWQFLTCGTFIVVTWSWRLLLGIISSRYALMLLPAACFALVYFLYNLPQITAWALRKVPAVSGFLQKNYIGIARCIIAILVIAFFCKSIRCNPYQHDILKIMDKLNTNVKNKPTALTCNYYDARILYYVKNAREKNIFHVNKPMTAETIAGNIAANPEADTIFFIGKLAKKTENTPEFQEYLKKAQIRKLEETWINKKKRHKFVLYQYDRRSSN